MANPTTNYSFVLPTSADLVTDLPADFDIALQGVDTRLKALQPGTTAGDLAYSSATANTNVRLGIGTAGQVLSVVSGAPAWATAADQTPLTTKGDLFSFTTVDARLAVGANGETLVANSSTATGLSYQGNYAAGKNKIINGDFGVWQRGTTFTAPGIFSYTSDRWQTIVNGTVSGLVVSQQTFTPGSAPVAGYEGTFFIRQVVTAQSGGSVQAIGTRLEDVRLFAGQTVTLSFYARADATRTFTTRLIQNFGSGGSSEVSTSGSSLSVTTSFTRFTQTFTVPGIAAKTIGASSYLYVIIDGAINTAQTMDIWGVQLEAGSVATAFQTATGTIQGETSACQRYYIRQGGDTAFQTFGWAQAFSATSVTSTMTLPVKMRVAPTSVEFSTIRATDLSAGYAISAVNIDTNFNSSYQPTINTTHATGTVAGRFYYVAGNNSINSYLAFSAEL